MVKQTQNFTQLYMGLLVCIVTTMALFFSSCKKKEMPEIKPTYMVTFNSKGGSAVNAIKVKQGDALTLTAYPTKNGFTFGGWYTDSEASTSPFSASTAITANLTLYAKWNVFSLSSTSFTDGGEIPSKYASPNKGQADCLNISPQLSWANAPAGTTSFLIIMEDKIQKHSHWCVYNIPADKTFIAENDPLLPLDEYEGPWGAQNEKKHTYQITIFALDLPEDYFSNNTPLFKAEAEQQLNSHILASASIKGYF